MIYLDYCFLCLYLFLKRQYKKQFLVFNYQSKAHPSVIKKIYKIGGASAIGAMAYGTQSIPKVDVITGPGNIFVATAKKLVYGEVNIDMIAGPSEIGILADSSAREDFLAIDLLSQAEHDQMASSILITTDASLADTLYVSVVIKGNASIILGKEEKTTALNGLMKKYQPEGGYEPIKPDMDVL